jgi:hypothetical protein
MKRALAFLVTCLFSQHCQALEWKSMDLTVNEDVFHFSIFVKGLAPSATESFLTLYTKSGIFPDFNEERFHVGFDSVTEAITSAPAITPIGVPTPDPWHYLFFHATNLTRQLAIQWQQKNGTQPFLSGDTLGAITVSHATETLIQLAPAIGVLPPEETYLSKSSTTRWVTAIGQVVPYSYTILNGSPVIVQDVALQDDRVDDPPVCNFQGSNEPHSWKS